jgi:hypothetical protein
MIVYRMTQAAFLACPQGPVAGPGHDDILQLYPGIMWFRGSEVVLAVVADEQCDLIVELLLHCYSSRLQCIGKPDGSAFRLG